MARTLESVLQQHVAGLPGVLAVLIGRTTDDQTIAEINYDPEAVADIHSLGAYASDLVRTNVRFCQLFDAQAMADYILAGSGRIRLLVKAFPKSPYFVLMMTKVTTELKLVIERLKAILLDAQPLLPDPTDTTKSTAQLLLDYARRYAPDPNFVLLRLSLKTGLDPEKLAKGHLSANEVRLLYRGVAELLGVERLPITVD
ncbi:MAG: hypothetical protein NZ821_04075 [Gloeomargarita sp. SKYB31]|nr:hypothetical protein [Gloeomargarita sp. SKYB31]